MLSWFRFGQKGIDSMGPQPDVHLPIACDLRLLDTDQRTVHLAHATDLLGHAAQEIQELADGYAFRFAARDYAQVIAFIANERVCCAFLTFVLEVPAAQQSLWLRITGQAGVKAFLRTALLAAQSVSPHPPDSVQTGRMPAPRGEDASRPTERRAA
jgi:hypothetical protein